VVSQSSGPMSTTATRAVPQQGAVCTISTDPASGRLLVRWQGRDRRHQAELAVQWRRTFGKHSQSCRRTDGSRSVPAGLRGRVIEWCESNGLDVQEVGHGG
jgi:hypothetical protein